MKEYNSAPADLRVAIGPAAAACCYGVGAEDIEGFMERFPSADELFIPTREGHARIDLLKANRDQLIAAGVITERIHTAPCARCAAHRFAFAGTHRQVVG